MSGFRTGPLAAEEVAVPVQEAAPPVTLTLAVTAKAVVNITSPAVLPEPGVFSTANLPMKEKQNFVAHEHLAEGNNVSRKK